MSGADMIILGIIGLSMVVGVFKGFLKEVLALAMWVAAFWVGFAFMEELAVYLERAIDIPSARLLLAFFALFLVTLVTGGLILYFVSQVVKKTGLSGTDRMLGLAFGALRGVLIIAVATLLAGLTPVTKDPWWQDSVLIPHFEKAARWGSEFLPESVREYLDWDGVSEEIV